MQATQPKLLDAVVLLKDRRDASLKAGQVGTVVELLGEISTSGAEAYEVEFSDVAGRTAELACLRRDEFLVLLPTPEALTI